MSRPKNGKSKIIRANLKREDILNGDISCPLCGREVSAYRVACFLEQAQKHKDFMSRKCPICRI